MNASAVLSLAFTASFLGAGIVAFNEPGLMDREVYFHVRSHGYEFPADGLGTLAKGVRL
jgi:hypothetical protein